MKVKISRAQTYRVIQMKYVNVKGEEVPALGFGTWQLKGEECVKGVKNALNIGYRHIDTARVYENEEEVGTAISESDVDREAIWLTTKLHRKSLTGDISEEIDKSLENLQTDYVDLLLIHWPFPEIDFGHCIREMEKAVKDGRVRNVGISNFNTSQMDEALEASETGLLTNQVEYHPFLSQEAVLEKCRENGMMLTAYSPLARGKVIGNRVLKKLGNKYGKSEVQIALRWLVQQDGVSAIPKASTEQHIEDNFDIFDFELNEGEMQEIHELDRNKRLIDNDYQDWD